ncbi:MAG: succinate dehydrogenase, cytochrome b556 subunit [Chloroflexi bacterium]|nr:succinate dehydrogenase, cytochrome b556 subunit [Chloroflexota bacterium]
MSQVETPLPEAISPLAVEKKIKVMEECAECLLCSSVCPAYARVEGYVGPMTYVKIAQRGFDERDAVNRLAEAARGKVFECVTCFRCEEICPHEIPIRQMAIYALRRIGASSGAAPQSRPFDARNFLPPATEPPQVERQSWLERFSGSRGRLASYETGMWAWILGRVSGWVLAFYLFLHLWVIALATWGGATNFNEFMRFFTNPLFLALDVGLLLAVTYHGTNSLRVILVDLVGQANHKALFWGAVVLTLLVGAVSVPVFFKLL